MSPLPFVLFLLAPAAARVPDLESPSTAEACGRCHRAIYEAWSGSAHAKAMESRLFQDALELAESDSGSETRRMCLGCHAPVAVYKGDLPLRLKVSWEGVTCDYCHSVRSVTTAGRNPRAIVDYSLVKSGSLKDASSSAHGAEFSPVHTSSLLCAGCHEYRNSSGFPVLATFSEWKNSRSAKEGKECQSCHMSRVAGDVVDPRVQRSREAKINLHLMPGSHSLDQLTSTVKMQLAAVRAGDRAQVSVDVTNLTAGHYVPTGSPMRQIILEVRADTSAGEHFREERIYRRSVADSKGAPIDREYVAFLKAAKVLADTRLAPGEKKTETIFFPLPSGTSASIKATLWYYYSPLARTESQKRITFATITRQIH